MQGLAGRLADAARMFTPTPLLGDVYGHNVLLPSAGRAGPTLIVWGSARVGSAGAAEMLDVAETAYDHFIELAAQR